MRTEGRENLRRQAVSEKPCKNNGIFKSDDLDSEFFHSMQCSELHFKWFVKCLDLMFCLQPCVVNRLQ